MDRKRNESGASISVQHDKFVEAARDAGASEDEADFDRALGKIAKAPPTEGVKERKRQKPETKKPAK